MSISVPLVKKKKVTYFWIYFKLGVGLGGMGGFYWSFDYDVGWVEPYGFASAWAKQWSLCMISSVTYH